MTELTDRQHKPIMAALLGEVQMKPDIGFAHWYIGDEDVNEEIYRLFTLKQLWWEYEGIHASTATFHQST